MYFNSISIAFKWIFNSISNDFKRNFDSISIGFTKESNSISRKKFINFSMEFKRSLKVASLNWVSNSISSAPNWISISYGLISNWFNRVLNRF